MSTKTNWVNIPSDAIDRSPSDRGFILFLVVALWFGLRVYQERAIQEIQNSLEALNSEASRDVDEIADLDASLREYNATWKKALSDSAAKLRQRLLEDRTLIETSLNRVHDALPQSNLSASFKIAQETDDAERLFKVYFESTKSILDGRMLTSRAETEIDTSFQQLLRDVNDLQQFFEEVRMQNAAQGATIVKKLREQDLFLLVISLSGIVALSLVIWFIVGSPLMQLSRGMDHIQKSQWRDPLPEKGFGEIADLIRNFNDMAETLSVQKHLLEKQATTDELTGLLNFRSFQERMAVEMERAKRTKKPLTLIIADIDFFKKYNDTQGHLAGNEALKTVAHHIREGCRPYDLVARFGGEEFAVVLPEATKEQGLLIAERIRTRAQGGSPLTLSCGIATYPQDADTLQALIAQADKRLYEAKDRGRNRVCA